MKNLPYFRWYPADAETDTLYCLLRDSELGFFHRCLNLAWINDGLPGDMDRLSRIMRVPRHTLSKYWVRVGRLFELAPDGRYRNKRQEEERAAATSKSLKASAATAHGRKPGPGFIYLIRRPSDSSVKIGSSGNVAKRIAQLRYRYNEGLELIAKFFVDDMAEMEVKIHQEFSAKRLEGEWFTLSAEDMQKIAITLGGDMEGDSTDHPDPRALARADSDSVSKKERGVGEENQPAASRRRAEAWRADPVFVKFAADYNSLGAAVIDEDFASAYAFGWKALDWEQKAERVKSLEAHAAEYRANPRFIPSPEKFLKQEYKRPLRPPPAATKAMQPAEAPEYYDMKKEREKEAARRQKIVEQGYIPLRPAN